MTEPRIGENRVGQRVQFLVERIVRHANIRKAHRGRLDARVSAARQHHLARLGQTDAPRQPLAHPPDWSQRPSRMSVGKFRRLGRDDQISRQRQLERAGVAMSMHRTDDRLRKISEQLDRLGLKVRLRRTLSLRDVGEIVSGGEALARAAHDDQPDALGFARDLIDVLAQFDEHLDVERVEFLGAIERSVARPSRSSRSTNPAMIVLRSICRVAIRVMLRKCASPKVVQAV